ncbi:MAG: hypothetical protein IJV13_05895 [Prevotella sp.]|nr:hypothetical protein [Prevotella sp.]
MKKYILLALLSTVLLMTSCLNNDSSEDITYYNDSAITGFSLGTLNRYLHTTSSTGEDSIYKRTYAGSTYKFTIDQQNRKIYNLDSLLINTDPEHIICAISTKNSGIALIKSLEEEDTWLYYSSSDSIDFSTPREFRIFDMTGQAYRDYTIEVNVHKEDGDVFNWAEKSQSEAFKQMSGLKAAFLNQIVYVFGNQGGTTVGYKTAATDGENWQQLTFNINHILDADAYKNIMVWGEKLYLLDKGSLLASTDGETWESMGGAKVLSQLVACNEDKFVAIDGDGKLVSTTDFSVWTEEELSDDMSLFPTECIGFVNNHISSASYASELMVIGNRSASAYPEDANAVVWRQIDEQPVGDTHPWTYLESDDTNIYSLPNLTGLTIMPYGEYLLALGGKGQGASTAAAFDHVYVSHDGGITWKKDSRFSLPESLDATATGVGMVSDNDNFVWVVLGGTGQVFRGRLNAMGWKTVQTEFKY